GAHAGRQCRCRCRRRAVRRGSRLCLGHRLILRNRLRIVVSSDTASLVVVGIVVAAHSERVREPVDPPGGDAQRRRHGIVVPHISPSGTGIPPAGPGTVIPASIMIARPVLPVLTCLVAIVLAALLA